ncbi:MAG: glutamyl-tRNA amidotransferase [Gammaproteobacteria bacterium]|nr:MAG: glutamyl-tRNA amidotransferase [Gammaproteobacteria bacterium]
MRPWRAAAVALAALGALTLAAGCRPAAPPAAGIQVLEASLETLQQAILSGDTSCAAVVEAHLARIEAFDTVRGLGAITFLNPAAPTRAAELDAALARGETPGPLFCAPLLVKDNFDTHDLPTTAGSIALAEHRPEADAFVLARLRAAGAIVLAKTNMGEWAFSPRQTVSSTHGRTVNAYAPARTPAGSSGGTASGVAASFGVAGLGTDTGNSVRGPSAHLGLVGLRPTLGLVSRSGIVPLAWDRDTAGPMARSVRDAARLLDVMAGSDPEDDYTLAADARRAADYTAALDRDALQGRRLAVLWPHADPQDSDLEVTTLFTRALEDLEHLGATLLPAWRVPELDTLLTPEMFCGRFRYDMARYLERLGARAPLTDVAEVLDTGQHSPDVEAGLRRALETAVDRHPGDSNPNCREFAAHEGRQALLAAVTAAMDADAVDALVFPSWRHAPAALETAVEDYRGDNSQGVVPAAGLPAVTVPMGMLWGELPAGLQFVGRRWDDARLLAMAYAYEQGTSHRRPPQGFPPLTP